MRVDLDTISRLYSIVAGLRKDARTIIQSVERYRNDVAMSLPNVGAGTQNQQKNLSSLCNGLESPRIE